MHHYLVEFDFIENVRGCHTAYAGHSAKSDAEAIQEARKWFGFDNDGITVIHTTVKQLD